MSAFMVGKAHIDALVNLAQKHHSYWSSDMRGLVQDGDKLGQMLVAENVASVRYRYPKDKPEQLPGSTDHLEPYRHSPFRSRLPSEVEGLKLICCYRYQSCEHPAWEASTAKRFCETLRETLIHALPGYDEAPWEWSYPTPQTRSIPA